MPEIQGQGPVLAATENQNDEAAKSNAGRGRLGKAECKALAQRCSQSTWVFVALAVAAAISAVILGFLAWNPELLGAATQSGADVGAIASAAVSIIALFRAGMLGRKGTKQNETLADQE